MFDVVITTYNRHEKVAGLVDSLLALSGQGRMGKVIVVDSSEATLSPSRFNRSPHLLVLRSGHRNQPYQRRLGLSASKSEYVLFLDDDMEIIDDSFCEDLVTIMQKGFAGVNLKFRNDNEFLSSLEKSVVSQSKWTTTFRRLSGYPVLSDNQFWLAGIRGKRRDGANIYYLNGGAFLAKRTLLFKGISSTLWDIYENGLGKGEDAITGFALSRQGDIWAHDKTYFYHNDQKNSVYATNHHTFNRRVAYSRLFLSFEYSRLAGVSRSKAILHFIWYSIWRIFGLTLNLAVRPSKQQLSAVTGYLAGFTKVMTELAPIYFSNRENKHSDYWHCNISEDLDKSAAG